MRAIFHWRQRERKLDVFFFAKKAQDVCRAVVEGLSLPYLAAMSNVKNV
jgi:hypothetical protein